MPMSMRCINVSSRSAGEVLIKEIKSVRKGIEVSFSDGNKLLFSPDSYTEFHLYLNKEVGPAEYRKLQSYAESDALYSFAISSLSRSLLSVKEMRDKLNKKNKDSKLVETVISRLLAQHLLDDEAYIKEYLEYRAMPSLYGKKRILFELSRKGISEKRLSKLTFPEEKEIERAKEFASLQTGKLVKLPFAMKKRKLLSSLQARGYSLEVAEQAVASIPLEFDDKLEQTGLEKEFNKAKAHYERKYEGYDLRERIYAALARKGYRGEDIRKILEDNDL